MTPPASSSPSAGDTGAEDSSSQSSGDIISHGPPASSPGAAIDAGLDEANGVSSEYEDDDDYFNSLLDKAKEYGQKASDAAKPVVEQVKAAHAKAKISWEELETGLDFGVVLAVNAILIACIFWTVVKKCCCGGHRYERVPVQDDVEMAQVAHDIPEDEVEEDEDEEDKRRVQHLQSHSNVHSNDGYDDWDDEDGWEERPSKPSSGSGVSGMKLGSKIPDSKSRRLDNEIRPGNNKQRAGKPPLGTPSGGSRYGGRSRQQPVDPDELFSQMGVEANPHFGNARGGEERRGVATRLAPSPTGGEDWGDDDFDVDDDISSGKNALERYGRSSETDFGN